MQEEHPEKIKGKGSEIMNNELEYSITKSGLNHRFRKIREMVNRMKENN